LKCDILDANIWIYASDSTAGEKHQQAIDIIHKAIFQYCVLTLQVLGYQSFQYGQSI